MTDVIRLANPLAFAVLDELKEALAPRRKMLAQYLGETEYYNKVSDCPPVTLVHGRLYQIAIDYSSKISNGWTIVRVYDDNGRYLTWIPYSVFWGRYWGLV